MEDQYGNTALPVTNDVPINLSSTSTTPQFAIATSGPWNATNATISSGTSCTNVYYKDSTAGSYTLSTSAPNLSSDQQAITIVPNDLVRLEIIPASFSVAQNATQQMIANVYNQNNEIEPDVTVVWSMADPTAGAINQSGLFYPSKTSKSYPNAIKASVGNLEAFADVTVTDATNPSGDTPTPYPTSTPAPTPTPIIITQLQSGTASSSTTTNNVTNNTTNSPNYSILIINNYYIGSSSTQNQSVEITRSGYPVILSPKDDSLIDPNAISVSGTSDPNVSIVITNTSRDVLATTTSDKNGNWSVDINKNQFSGVQQQITATIQGSSLQSTPVTFYLMQQDWLSQLRQILGTL